MDVTELMKSMQPMKIYPTAVQYEEGRRNRIAAEDEEGSDNGNGNGIGKQS